MAESYGLTAQSAHEPDNLLLDNFPVFVDEIILISGQNLSRGALLGKITASGKYTLSLSAAIDGSEAPVAILARDTDASAGDVKTNAYFFGSFNSNKVILGAGHTLASVQAALRQIGLFLKVALGA